MFLFSIFFVSNVSVAWLVHAFPAVPSIPSQSESVLPYPYYTTRMLIPSNPCIWNFRPYMTGTYRSENGDAYEKLAPTYLDSIARFNIHLYLDHMWHLNVGFSR